MQIDFDIDGKPVQYFREPMLGTSELRTPDGNIEIDSPLSLGTHFSFKLKKERTVQLYGHSVTVEKVRPLFFAGFSSFEISHTRRRRATSRGKRLLNRHKLTTARRLAILSL
jgi:hypothetical protein